MIKKITGGILTILLAGGMFFSAAAPASAQGAVPLGSDVVAIDSSIPPLVIIYSAADTLGETPLSLIIKMFSEKKSIKEIIEDSGMDTEEFVDKIRTKILYYLSQTEINIPGKMGEYIQNLLESQSPLSQLYVTQMLNLIHQHPAGTVYAAKSAFKVYRKIKRFR